MAANPVALGWNRGLSHIFLWLRNADREKFTKALVMLTEKHI